VALFGFPNPVNEKAARVVAGGVVLLSALTIVLGATLGHSWLWITAAIAYGFVARVATGPKLSPLGQLATRVIAPRLGAPKQVPGPPKRFAQAIGAVVTLAATVLVAVGVAPAVYALLGLMVFFATLESVFGFCVGCAIFGWLMRRGVIPQDVCAECADVTARYAQVA
jgi:hypothetical protein